MTEKKPAKFCLDSLIERGAEKSQCVFAKSEKHELNVDTGRISLLRTTFNAGIGLTVIKDRKKGSMGLNRIDREAAEKAVENVLEIAEASQQDDAYDISEKQPAGVFDNNIEKPDLNKMHDKLASFLSDVKRLYPQVILRDVILDFTRSKEHLLNSNGVNFVSKKGLYSFGAMFSSKDGKKSSSFNYTGVTLKDIEKELLSCGSLDRLLRQSVEQLETKQVKGKFTGDIIVTPDCIGDLISFITENSLSDGALISGTSVYKNKLGERIADPRFTLRSMPISDEIADGYWVTPDGFKAENLTVVDKGVLKTFLLGLYGSKKTGLKRALNSGGCYVIEPGDKSFNDMVKSVKRGILVSRISGGEPNDNGDFSAVVKNSYLIEDGEIKYPISETMMSANIPEMFMNIKDISEERTDFGSGIFPWISFPGIAVSGK